MQLRSMGLALASALLAGAAFAAPAHAAEPLNLCTGKQDGYYYGVGQQLAKDLKNSFTVNVLPSPGSEANLKRMSGQDVMDNAGAKLPPCNAAIVQADAIPYFNKTYRGNNLNAETVTPLFPETFQLICGKESGIGKIKDLYGTKGKKIAIGEPGSGTAITWSNFIASEKRYAPIETDSTGGQLAINRVKSGDLACVAMVGGVGVGPVQTLNDQSTGNLVLVDINDGDLTATKDAKGKPIYRWTKIDKKSYPALMSGYWSGADTVAEDAILIVDANWATSNETAYATLSAKASAKAKQWGAGQ